MSAECLAVVIEVVSTGTGDMAVVMPALDDGPWTDAERSLVERFFAAVRSKHRVTGYLMKPYDWMVDGL